MLYLTPFITAYCVFLAALTGSCMGSFLNCMAWRIVHGESVMKGRSHCDKCGHVLGAADLVPIFSYLFHKGRCRYCGAALSKCHLIAEVLAAVVFVSILLKFNISLQALKYLIFACVLLAACKRDAGKFLCGFGGIYHSGSIYRCRYCRLCGFSPVCGESHGRMQGWSDWRFCCFGRRSAGGSGI